MSQGSPDVAIIPQSVIAISVDSGDGAPYDEDGDLTAKPPASAATATKLTVKEEVSEGHVGWKPRRLQLCHYRCSRLTGSYSEALLFRARWERTKHILVCLHWRHDLDCVDTGVTSVVLRLLG